MSMSKNNEQNEKNTNQDSCYTVYMHVNKENDKKYIGITRKSVVRRWNNGRGYCGNVHFWNAIQKYGWKEGFDHIILFEKLSKEEAEEKEIELIKKYNTTNQDYGYNIQLGGRHIGCLPQETKDKISIANTGKKHTDETKRKMSEKAKQMTKEHKQKIADAHKGLKPWNTGVVFSEEEKDKIKGNTYRAVYCTELDMVFKSLSYAYRITGVHQANIRKVCNGERHVAGGYHWEYVDANDSKFKEAK